MSCALNAGCFGSRESLSLPKNLTKDHLQELLRLPKAPTWPCRYFPLVMLARRRSPLPLGLLVRRRGLGNAAPDWRHGTPGGDQSVEVKLVRVADRNNFQARTPLSAPPRRGGHGLIL